MTDSRQERATATDPLWHVRYEAGMLYKLARALRRDRKVEPWQRNAYLESFLIHARNLNHFLYRQTGQNDDLLAVDVLDGYKVPDKKPKALRDLDTKVNKHLAHITEKRLADEQEWDCAAIARALLE